MRFRKPGTFIHRHIVAGPRFEPCEPIRDQRKVFGPNIAHAQVIDPVDQRRRHHIGKAEILPRQPRPVFQRALHTAAGQFHLVDAFLHGIRAETVLGHLKVEMLAQRARASLLIRKFFIAQPLKAVQKRLVKGRHPHGIGWHLF